jgi:hypothetical protein
MAETAVKPFMCVCGHNRSWHRVGNPFFPDREDCELCAECSRTYGEHSPMGHRFALCVCRVSEPSAAGDLGGEDASGPVSGHHSKEAR